MLVLSTVQGLYIVLAIALLVRRFHCKTKKSFLFLCAAVVIFSKFTVSCNIHSLSQIYTPDSAIYSLRSQLQGVYCCNHCSCDISLSTAIYTHSAKYIPLNQQYTPCGLNIHPLTQQCNPCSHNCREYIAATAHSILLSQGSICHI